GHGPSGLLDLSQAQNPGTSSENRSANFDSLTSSASAISRRTPLAIISRTSSANAVSNSANSRASFSLASSWQALTIASHAGWCRCSHSALVVLSKFAEFRLAGFDSTRRIASLIRLRSASIFHDCCWPGSSGAACCEAVAGGAFLCLSQLARRKTAGETTGLPCESLQPLASMSAKRAEAKSCSTPILSAIRRKTSSEILVIPAAAAASGGGSSGRCTSYAALGGGGLSSFLFFSSLLFSSLGNAEVTLGSLPFRLWLATRRAVKARCFEDWPLCRSKLGIERRPSRPSNQPT